MCYFKAILPLPPEPAKAAILSRQYWSLPVYVFPETDRAGSGDSAVAPLSPLLQEALSVSRLWKVVFEVCLPLILLTDGKKDTAPICCPRCGWLWCTGYACHRSGKNNSVKFNKETYLTRNMFNKLPSRWSGQRRQWWHLGTLAVFSEGFVKRQIHPSPAGESQLTNA